MLFGRPPVRNDDAESVLEVYARALTLGASGIEGTAWATTDGVVVLSDRDSVRSGFRRRPIGAVSHSSLPAGTPSLGEIYERCGADFEVALDVADVDTAAAVIGTARAFGGEPLARRLWLISTEWEHLAQWRERWADVRLVNRTRLRGLRQGPERRAAQLAGAHIDAVVLSHAEWSGGLTTLFHRFERLAFASDAKHERVMSDLLRMGIDGMSSDEVARMVGTLGRPDD